MDCYWRRVSNLDGGVGGKEANARLTKMSVIENTIPKTIPVTTVFMEGSLVGPQSQKHVKRLFEFIARGAGIVKHLFELSSLCRQLV